MDTPETVDPRAPMEFVDGEARERSRRMAQGKVVCVKFSSHVPTRD
jgi:hypothetical protein